VIDVSGPVGGGGEFQAGEDGHGLDRFELKRLAATMAKY
jgi:hypothetical protein